MSDKSRRQNALWCSETQSSQREILIKTKTKQEAERELLSLWRAGGRGFQVRSPLFPFRPSFFSADLGLGHGQSLTAALRSSAHGPTGLK